MSARQSGTKSSDLRKWDQTLAGANLSWSYELQSIRSQPKKHCLSTLWSPLYDPHAHHVINTCIHCNKTRAHNLIQDRLVSIVRDAGYSVTTRVPTIEVQDQHIRADIYIPQRT